ncbi:hypothetical protein [Phaeodactylibacter sp.]|uniref:hypothetical protein n=1 Tax=Phaeodactylibacter sp. TaxID=1940289 RepID=UPI0025F3BC4A|nr:hypothetical protein [Phaeodactylibacter sp.]MCI4649090.1 hypothetical protein [Phaeodactylibacter sp.]MCI5092816.1 hypothetical protein [Phaeodactylibacter sp.]
MKNFLKSIGRFWMRYYLLILLLFAGYRAANTPGRFIRGMIWSDAEGYYLYLPAVLIQGGFEDFQVRTEAQFPNYEGTNKRFTKYTCGVAMLELPFFLIGHFWAKVLSMPADGYSYPYIVALQLAGLFYGFLGLLLLKEILARYFKPVVVMMTVAGFFLGTNLYHYILQEPGMSHVYSFFLFGLFVWLTPRFYEQPGLKIFGGMGLLAGLIVLIRPTNILLLLYLLLFGLRSWADVRERLLFFWKYLGALLLAPIASFLVFVPQFLYWKYISGNWLIYSYGEEGFNWLEPRVDMVLFHIKNGWLLFSPMAGLAIIGCLVGMWKNRCNIAPIFLIWLLLLYITSCWWCWWFGGAFGHRQFVEFYVLLAIPYAWLFTQVLESKVLALKIFLVVLWLLLGYYGYMLAVHFRGPHYEWWSWKEVVEYMWQFKFDKKY